MTCKCDNCAWIGDESETELCADFWSRVEPGDIVPSGDCPECGAFCFPVEHNKISVTLTMTLTDAEGKMIGIMDAKNAIHATQRAIRNRLLGEGFLPDDILVETHAIEGKILNEHA